MKYSYYPGCSLHGSSREYDTSTQVVCSALDIQLEELTDWICCGASSGHAVDETINLGLPTQNLKIAQATGKDLAVPCAACFHRLKAAEHSLKTDESIKTTMKEILDFDYDGSIQVLNLVDLVYNRVGLQTLKEKTVQPLQGLKAACYYGCLLVRPPEITDFDHPDHPQTLDQIMNTVGATSLEWSYKTECCGGSLALTRGNLVTTLVDDIIDYAIEAGANAVVTACPLCFENLEGRQTKNMPIFYFTELLGLAFGLEEAKHWPKQHMINPTPLLKSLGLL